MVYFLKFTTKYEKRYTIKRDRINWFNITYCYLIRNKSISTPYKKSIRIKTLFNFRMYAFFPHYIREKPVFIFIRKYNVR